MGQDLNHWKHLPIHFWFPFLKRHRYYFIAPGQAPTKQSGLSPLLAWPKMETVPAEGGCRWRPSRLLSPNQCLPLPASQSPLHRCPCPSQSGASDAPQRRSEHPQLLPLRVAMAHRWGQTPSRLRLAAVLCSVQLFLHYARLGVTVPVFCSLWRALALSGQGASGCGLVLGSEEGWEQSGHFAGTLWDVAFSHGLGYFLSPWIAASSSPACLWDSRTKARFPFKVSQKLALHVLKEQVF